MKIEIGEGRVTVGEGDNTLSVAELTGKVQAGLLYSTPIGDSDARFVKSPTAKMIYSIGGDTLPEQYLDGVDVAVTIMNLDRDAVTAEGRRSVKISSGLDQMAGPPRLGVRMPAIHAR